MSTFRRPAKSRAMRLLERPDEDPLSGVANLFDVAMVFAVALLLAMVTAMKMPELLFAKEDMTIIKNPGKPNMEIIEKRGRKLDRYTMSDHEMGGEGQRLGVCYRIDTGEIVYVPETGAPEEGSAP